MMQFGVAVVLTLSSLVSQDAQRETHENLHATLWMQTSAEYIAVATQTYAAATEQLEAIARRRDPRGLAVVLDIDETVLDNSPYQARLVRDNEGYIRQRDVFRSILMDAGVEIVGDESILAADTDFTLPINRIWLGDLLRRLKNRALRGGDHEEVGVGPAVPAIGCVRAREAGR